MVGCAEIVGAGVAGLTVAAALARRGWAVTLREAAPAVRAHGGGLYLSADAFAAASELGFADDLRTHSYAPPAFETIVNGVRRSIEPNAGNYRTGLRTDLHALLSKSASNAGVDIKTAQRVASVTVDGRIEIEGDAGAQADLVVIAQGVASTLPPMLGLKPQRKRFDEGLMRVFVDRTVMDDASWDNSRDFWSGHPRLLRILYTPCSATHCYLFMMAPTDEQGAITVPARSDIWAETFPEVSPLLAGMDGDIRFDRYGSLRLDSWRAGRVAVLGDAAHAMPSSIGRGANMAMKSAITLANSIKSSSSVEAGLEVWEATMRPTIDQAQQLAEKMVMERRRAVQANAVLPRRSSLETLKNVGTDGVREEDTI